jgi:Na+/H+ antiporter
MHVAQELIALLVAVALLAWGARAVGVPYPIVLVAGGIAIGFLPGMPEVELEPEIIFLVFLPPLVHFAGYSSGVRRLRDHARSIALLALGLVAATIAAVAVVAHAVVPELGWAAAAALGAIVAPTDPVAATAVFRRAGAPERVTAIVEGESLVNDATALVTYRLAVAAAVSGTFSLLEGVGDLLVVSAGGTAVGLAGAWVAGWVRRRLDDALIEITITLLTPYATYITAEALGVSGILAAVVSGVVLGAQAHRLFSAGTRLESNAFWSVLTFLLESTLFILVGLQAPAVLDALPGTPGELALDAAAIVATVVAVRLIVTLGVRELPLRERLIVGWTGMRGAVSLAAALSIPLTTDAGEPFPGRELIIFLTLVVIAVTLVGQGLTLPLLLRRVVAEPAIDPAGRANALARFESVGAALEHIGELSLDREVPAPLVERARELYTSRASQLAGECRVGVAEAESDTAAWLRLRLALLGVERSSLVDLRDRGEITNAVMVSVERDLDLEEERLRARLAAPVASQPTA